MSIDPVTTDANTGSSFNRYAYVNNNPYKYIDPDGRALEASNKDTARVLGWINSQSAEMFASNGTNLVGVACQAGSEYYAAALMEAAASTDVVSIHIADNFKLQDDKIYVSDYGGAVTAGPATGGRQDIYVSGLSTREPGKGGGTVLDTAADKLTHEVVGHATPHVAGSDTGNAITNSNKVREELGKPLRAPDPKHTENYNERK